MIIQFIDVECTSVGVAKLVAWLEQNSAAEIPRNDTEIFNQFGLVAENFRDGGIAKRAIEQKRDPSIKWPHTPIDDWYQIPFLVDRNERPVTAANAWLRHICKNGSPKTWRTYAYALFDYFQFLEWKKIDWRAANDFTLTSYRIEQELSDSKHKKAHRGRTTLSPNTIQLRLMTAARFYTYAALYGHIPKNPITHERKSWRQPLNSDFLAHIQRPREREVPVVAYNRGRKNRPFKWQPHESVWTWMNSIKGERNKLIAKLLYQTGMRREEIILWQVNHIPEMDVLQNDPQLKWIEFPIRGKGGSSRLIRISVKNFIQLRHWIDHDRAKILKRSNLQRDHGFVWIAARDGHPLQPISLNHIFDPISEKCGIWMTPHMLRHSFSVQKRSDLYADNVRQPEKVLQGLLGHRSVVTTIEFYGHISPEDEAMEAESNSDFLDKLLAERPYEE